MQGHVQLIYGSTSS